MAAMLRVVDLVPSSAADPAAPVPMEAWGESRLTPNQQTLIALFGTLPDHSQPGFQAILAAFAAADDYAVVSYCAEQGVDVLDDDGRPVPGFIQIAAVLKARATGVLQAA